MRNGTARTSLRVTAVCKSIAASSILLAAFSNSLASSPSPRPTPAAPSPPAGKPAPIAVPSPLRALPEYRSFDGKGNNREHPDWGAAGTPLLRLTSVAYGDGRNSPAGADRVSARLISNAVCAQEESTTNAQGASDYIYQWGQFLDHDITSVDSMLPVEEFDVAVPEADPEFDPTGTGTQVIPLSRSQYVSVNGVRQQINGITAFIDASQVYGSDEARARALRALDGTGRLRTSEGNLLPFNTTGMENFPPGPEYFVAGDLRVNEQPSLTSVQTLFVREHNYWADRIREQNRGPQVTTARPRPGQPQVRAMTDDDIYKLARAIVGAEMQAITYREFLPTLLGPRAIPPYRGYRANLEPLIANEFATAAYRLGHSLLSSDIPRRQANGEAIDAGDIPLSQAFFLPSQIIVENGGIDPILRGLAMEQAQELDPYIINDVRNFLFGAPGAGGFDLASLNIQRGRDHGLPGFNRARHDLGLRVVTSFAQISRDSEIQRKLALVYPTPDDVDLWIGLLSEDHVPQAMVGETLMTILTEQFVALRDGDRFWYQRYLTPDLVKLVEAQTLSTIVRRNTTIRSEVPDNIFRFRQPRPDKRFRP